MIDFSNFEDNYIVNNTNDETHLIDNIFGIVKHENAESVSVVCRTYNITKKKTDFIHYEAKGPEIDELLKAIEQIEDDGLFGIQYQAGVRYYHFKRYEDGWWEAMSEQEARSKQEWLRKHDLLAKVTKNNPDDAIEILRNEWERWSNLYIIAKSEEYKAFMDDLDDDLVSEEERTITQSIIEVAESINKEFEGGADFDWHYLVPYDGDDENIQIIAENIKELTEALDELKNRE